MNNTTPLFKRALAYIIDLCIVVIVSSLISSIPFLNKEIKPYQEKYKEYELAYKEYQDVMTLLEETYEDKILSEEELNKFNKFQYYQIIEEKYDDMELTEEEHKEIVEKINKEYSLISNDYIYLLNKNSTTNTIITLICTLLYFGVLQYFLKGQTIGKKILKLQVVSATDKKLNIFNFILRSLIVNDILLNTVGTFFLVYASKQVYTEATSIISTIISITEAVIIFTVLTRQDTRGLHDLLFGTKVISTVPTLKEKGVKIVEAK